MNMNFKTKYLILFALLSVSIGISVNGQQNSDRYLPEQRPVVVETFPTSDSRNVEPGLIEMRVRFSKRMKDHSWSWCAAWDNSVPEIIGEPHFDAEHRTCAVKVRLEPGRTYGTWLNTGNFNNFSDDHGHPSIPYLLIFNTKGSGPVNRKDRWIQDIEYFAASFPNRQKDFNTLISKKLFEQEIADLKTNVPRLSNVEIIFRLDRIIASLGVAHTAMNCLSGIGAEEIHLYPIQMHWFSDGLVVTATSPMYREALGARVAKIGAMKPEEIQDKISPYISHENQPWLRHQSVTLMALAELMTREQIAATNGKAQFTFAKSNGKTFTLEVAPESPRELTNWISARDALHIPTGLARNHPGSFYWWEYISNSKTIYLQYNRCTESSEYPFADFVSEVLACAASNLVQRVVVDLRYNAGGNSEIIKPLLQGLQTRFALSAPGHLYVLIGNDTFSSGADAALNFREDLHAIVIGAPTGGKPNCWGDIKPLTLPNSRLTIYYSTKHFNLIPDADPPSIEPDLTVPFSTVDFLSGRDPVLEAALAHSLPTN
jgi:hypothetical protein